jgi:SpoVK/Ycf46/Vps4 family AAA+-type ATPase
MGGSAARQALLAVLRGLDRLLDAALRLAGDVYGWEPGSTGFRGLYITPSDAGRMLAREVGASPFGELGAEPFFEVSEVPALASLAERYGLSWLECAIVVIALAPEIDLRYERLYAYLQDDVSRRRPTVDLILNLLCPSAAERLEFRSYFAPDSPLVRHRLVRVAADPSQPNAALLAWSVKLDEQVVRELLGSWSLDSRLGEVCECRMYELDLAALPLESETVDGLRRFAMESRTGARPLRIALAGPALPWKLRTAQAMASELARPLLSFDLRQVSQNGTSDLLQVAVREARAVNAILFADCEGVEERSVRQLAAEISFAYADAILCVATHNPALDDAGVTTVELPRSSFATRREQWRRSLDAARIELPDAELDSLAGRFRLYPDEIVAAVLSAESKARWRGSRQVAARDLSAAARAHSGRQIGNMARKVDPKYQWDDIVLPSETLGQLHAICARVVHQHRVLDEWGFDRKLSMGKGVTALFAGPSGVGKTMAAEVIATELDIDLYKIDLSGVVSKYIGETEKNLDRIFTAAENANAILFFDEADALFGKRSEVKDSHDRYANIEISYLLQKMEMYDGVAILATNLRQNLDEAFLRRLAFAVHFPFPNQQDRRRIWESIWPSGVPLDPGADFEFLSSTFKLSGGNIKNVALAASFLAATEEQPVGMRHLVIAVDREYQKMGKPLAPDIFGPYAAEAAS